MSKYFIVFFLSVVIADCEAGICAKNAYWKDKFTLAIKIKKRLRENRTYTVTLGDGKSKLASDMSCELPVTRWIFTTGL